MLLARFLIAFQIVHFHRIFAHPASLSKPLMTREAEEVDADSYRHWLRKRSELLESAATASDKGQRLAATDADALRGLQGPNQFSGQISVAVGKEEGRSKLLFCNKEINWKR